LSIRISVFNTLTPRVRYVLFIKWKLYVYNNSTIHWIHTGTHFTNLEEFVSQLKIIERRTRRVDICRYGSRKSQIADFTDRFGKHLCSVEKFTDSGNSCGRFLSIALDRETMVEYDIFTT
jgi:hypothetical protein